MLGFRYLLDHPDKKPVPLAPVFGAGAPIEILWAHPPAQKGSREGEYELGNSTTVRMGCGRQFTRFSKAMPAYRYGGSSTVMMFSVLPVSL